MPDARGGSARALSLAWRALTVLVFTKLALLQYLWLRFGSEELDEDGLDRLRGRVLARLLERLGATFVKLGQILGTRPDLLSPGYVSALARLHDDVPPAPFADVERVLAEDLEPEARARIAHIDREPLAAASVAQVHRAVLDDGSEVALKLQRLAAPAAIDRDLAILAVVARLLDRIPGLEMLSLPGAVERFDHSLRGQLDFRLEAENNLRFAANFQGIDGISFPRLIPGLCTQRVLAMELIHGVKGTEAHQLGGDRARLARLGGEVVLEMVFVDGFVHADMHPGNVFYTDGGIVLIDLGMVAEIPPELQRPWAETFLALAMQDAKELARLFYGHAPVVFTADYAAFECDVQTHFAKLYGKKLGEVEVSEAVGGIMNILRKHHVQVEPVFTVVHVALLVAEGLGKQLDPTLDVVQQAVPYLQRALLESPPGRPMTRQPPPRLSA